MTCMYYVGADASVRPHIPQPNVELLCRVRHTVNLMLWWLLWYV